MITLITGAPGTGKTAALVSMLETDYQERAIYVYGIPDLTVSHFELSDPSNWMIEVPDGALIVIDEVQKFWRPAGSGSKLPEHISELETHRHRGLDFIVITQGSNLLHTNVRSLVGRHIHLRDVGVLGRYWYEWVECQDNVRAAWKTAPIKKRYRLPKSIFSKYKSASVHIKPNRSFPVVLAVLVIAALLFLIFAYRSYSQIKVKTSASVQTISSTSGVTTAQTNALKNQNLSLEPPNEINDFIPRISGKPWTAPAYDHLRQVVAMPHVISAICIGDDCKCYGHQTRLIDMPSKDCKIWARDKPFNPYLVEISDNVSADIRNQQHQTNQLPPSSSNENLSMRSPLPL